MDLDCRVKPGILLMMSVWGMDNPVKPGIDDIGRDSTPLVLLNLFQYLFLEILKQVQDDNWGIDIRRNDGKKRQKTQRVS